MITTLHRHPGVPAGWAGPRHARPGWAATVTGWWRTITTPAPVDPEPDHEGADEAYARELHALAAEIRAEAAAERPLDPDSTALHNELYALGERLLAPVRAAADAAIARLLDGLDGGTQLDAIGLRDTAEYHLVGAA